MIKATVNQSIYEVKEGTTLSDLAKQVQLPQEPIILLAYMDGKLRELFTPMTKDCHVRFVTLKEQAGYMAYKRTATLMFLLEPQITKAPHIVLRLRSRRSVLN